MTGLACVACQRSHPPAMPSPGAVGQLLPQDLRGAQLALHQGAFRAAWQLKLHRQLSAPALLPLLASSAGAEAAAQRRDGALQTGAAPLRARCPAVPGSPAPAGQLLRAGCQPGQLRQGAPAWVLQQELLLRAAGAPLPGCLPRLRGCSQPLPAQACVLRPPGMRLPGCWPQSASARAREVFRQLPPTSTCPWRLPLAQARLAYLPAQLLARFLGLRSAPGLLCCSLLLQQLRCGPVRRRHCCVCSHLLRLLQHQALSAQARAGRPAAHHRKPTAVCGTAAVPPDQTCCLPHDASV